MISKKAQEMLPVLAMLGLMVAFSIFFMYRMKGVEANSTNPFYGILGEREMHLTALHQSAEADRFVVDTLADYASQATLSQYATQYGFWTSAPCGNTNGYPLLNQKDDFCERPDSSLQELSKHMKDDLNENLYTRVVESSLAIPFNYDYQFIQEKDSLTIAGFAKDPVRYSLRADDFDANVFSPETETIEQPDFSTECTYLFSNAQKAEQIAGTSDGFTPHDHSYKTGPCPEGIQKQLVPYFNQCNIISCNQRNYCAIDESTMCQEGCGFTSLRMAYAYYGLDFDLSQTTPSTNLNGLFNELFTQANNKLKETITRPESGFDELIETPESNIEAYEGPYDTYLAAKQIGDKEYEQLLTMLDTGLVVVRIRGKSPGSIDCERFTLYSDEDEVGYCPKQHFFTIIAGNENYVIVNDPWTPNREYRSGINVVLSKEFLQKIWSGRYIWVRPNEE